MKDIFRFMIVTSCLFSSANISRAQWVQTNGPNGAEITCLATIGTNIFAGTSMGGVFISTDNGTTWSGTNDSPFPGIGALAVIGTTLFAGLNGPYDFGIWNSTDYGTSWNEAVNGLPVISITAFATTPNGSGGTNLFAGTGHGEFAGDPTGRGVFLSTNTGTSWTSVSTGLPDTLVTALAANGTGSFCWV